MLQSKNNFVDFVRIYCKSGKGGTGSKHLRRDRLTAKGGPDGGDGGRGGHIIIKSNRNKWTLLHLKYTKHIKSPNGLNGGKSLSTGADGNDVVIDVPIGTVVKDIQSDKFLFEFDDDNQKYILCKGGRGGKGNAFFKSSTRQTPRFSQEGENGVELAVSLELKVLADVGLVGLPNAGKSTLLSVITAAKPKIGDYEFTTLTPNLGMVNYRDGQSFVISDIPGIIEGAHKGRGLGHRFLRHIERNYCLLFLISIEDENIGKTYEMLLNELGLYDETMLQKKRIIVISKGDLNNNINERKVILKNLPKNIKCLFISSVSTEGLSELKDELWNILN